MVGATAGAEGVQIVCMQEIFTGPYFCAEQNTKWYDATEKIPDPLAAAPGEAAANKARALGSSVARQK